MKRENKTSLIEYGICALILSVWLLSGCSHLTVSPKPVESHAVALGDTNKPDANIIDGDWKGLHVRQGYMDDYRALEAKFKETDDPSDKLIVIETDDKYLRQGGKYVVPYRTDKHFTDMKARARLAEVGP